MGRKVFTFGALPEMLGEAVRQLPGMRGFLPPPDIRPPHRGSLQRWEEDESRPELRGNLPAGDDCHHDSSV
jgi:hypothetical protein